MTMNEPELKGYSDNPYRVWKHEQGVPFSVRRNGMDGAILVALDGWNITAVPSVVNKTRSGFDPLPDGKHQLHVQRANNESGPLDGTIHPSFEAAERAAYEAGLSGLMIYEKDRAKHLGNR